MWTNPRPPLEPASVTTDLGGGSPPDPTASTPGVSSKASGSEPPPGVHSKASSYGPPPGVRSKASPPQPAAATAEAEEESWIANGWVPDEKWVWQWMCWKARGPDQWDDVWSPDWKLTPIKLEDLRKGPTIFHNRPPPNSDAADNAATDQRGSSRDTNAHKEYPIPAPDDPYWKRMPTKKCPHCSSIIGIQLGRSALSVIVHCSTSR